jgi:Tfp pilus assembly protein PilF
MAPDLVVEDFAVKPMQHPRTGWYYMPASTDSGFYQIEFRLNENGVEDHRIARRMDYVVGSGTAARTYLNDTNGRLFQLPLSWYTQTGRWDFSPGYAEANKRFDRTVPDRCMACHNAYPESVPFADGKYSQVPTGIGCERCHGPGSLHADERLIENDAPDSIDFSIVNPDHLRLDRQLDVCQQCHLQTTVSLLRDGRGPFDFRPGLPLAEYVAYYYAAEGEADASTIDVISHADRMRQSACFVGAFGSDSPLTCTTCHDPHQGFRSAGESYFDTRCKSCHGDAELSARFDEGSEWRADHRDERAACSSCHMPKVRATDVTHASFTDHWIRIVREDDDREAGRSIAGEVEIAPVSSHDDRELLPYFRTDEDRFDEPIYRGMAYVVWGKQRADTTTLGRGRRILTEALNDHRGSYPEAWSLLGWSALAMGDARAAVDPLEEAIRIEGPVPERQNSLAQALEILGGDPVRIERLYADALSTQPAAADVRVNFGRFLEKQGRVEEAVQQYELSTAEVPTMATAHYNLGTAYLRLGDSDKAEAALLRSISLSPDYDEALGNLGLLYASLGRGRESGDYFRRAVTAAPGSPVANANLATYYLGLGEAAKAVPLLETAVQLDPGYVDARLNLAVAYFQVDEIEKARAQARAVLRIDPSNKRATEIIQALS